MATHFEVFDKLRDLGRSLDKVSNTLPTDGNTEETNKARARLQLKLLSTEAKNFKKEVAKSIADAKSEHTLESVLALCQKQAYKIKEDIENLEDHLTKYGYKKHLEKLPEIPIFGSAEDTDVESGDQCKSRSPQSGSSDKENLSPKSEHDETDESTEETNCPKLELAEPNQAEEVDLLATPVLPTTFTKFLQSFDTQEGDYTSPDVYKEPLLPVTATPLHRSFDENQGVATPESFELLTHPPKRTPMIKAVLNFDSPSADGTNDEYSLDFPAPPTFATPGLKQYGSKVDGIETSMHCDALDTPPPPRFASEVRLNADDICSTSSQNVPSAKSNTPAEFELPNKRTFDLPDINYVTYQELPDCLRGQFSFEKVNHNIKRTSDYLNARSEGNNPTVTDEELITVLQLGPYTKAFVLAMLKLGYFTIKKAGVYNVHSKT